MVSQKGGGADIVDLLKEGARLRKRRIRHLKRWGLVLGKGNA